MEGMEQRRGLGFFDEGEAGEGAGETCGDGGCVDGGELEFRQGGVDEIDAGDELLEPMINEREVEGSAVVGFGETASAGVGIEVAVLGLLLDDEVAIARDVHGGDALVFGIKGVLNAGAQMLGKHLGDPGGLDGGGQAEERQQGGAA